ncbi:hypothetical protein KC343_g2759 [Hortaea werneckii]|nr:hypothetical protein KC352_g9191 [Hortaea werneckii]KAI7315249.1 hypothetical protein KC340_g9056 [Hortaea werneckii]KAI7397337.1 hypothetical protein KC328_g4954 [Hortaea werneckii]KAI7568899.1 hypothetical protein KC317_g3779 [Hortaea werneckii]KAI7622137.1 hypothetical protein KC346_g3349 [Hortaea werneckii]
MAEAVGLAAGIIGIVVPALHGARLLLRDLEKITNVPDAMAKLKEDVASISASLVLLKDIDEPVWLSLGRWTKRSKGATLSWLDRVQVGFFRDQQLKAHTARLHAYRLTFNSIVETATLYSSFRTAQLTDELRSSIAFAPEVRSLPASDFTVDEGAELDTTITGLTEVLEALNLSQTLLQELSSKTESADNAKADADNKTTNITFGTNNQGMQMGNNYGTTTWTSKG